MGVKWTPEQESAIIAPKDSSLDNQTLLVAAAAGSGKTAVLVERIITRLKDMDNPVIRSRAHGCNLYEGGRSRDECSYWSCLGESHGIHRGCSYARAP